MALPELLDLDFYLQGTEVSAVVIQSALLALFISLITTIFAIRGFLKKRSEPMAWLGIFSSTYALWNLLYLASYTQRDLQFAQATLTASAAHRGHLIAALLLPALAYKFFSFFFFERIALLKWFLATAVLIALVAVIPLQSFYFWANIATGVFVFWAFVHITLHLFEVYRSAENLKIKTRAFFVAVGMAVCTFFSVVGQIRSELGGLSLPLPYWGNLLTAVFIYFLYQMTLNPRLREIRELMLRGIRVILMTLLLTIIFLSLLVWVGKDDPELFVFNTFIASFFILSLFEPVRQSLDRFFLKKFIVDRFEFEELLTRLQKKIRSSKELQDLIDIVLVGIKESGRIYQAGLFLWDQNARLYRLHSQSSLNFKTTLGPDSPLLQYLKEVSPRVLLELESDVPGAVGDELKEMHTHVALALQKDQEILGVWVLRTSLRSTNPYTSFSDPELDALNQVGQDVVNALDQFHHFESLERQKKLAALGELSGALAHELKNPLGAIHGAAQLLETSPTLLNAEDRECVMILKKEIDRMQQTIGQYLHFARTSESQEDVSLEGVVRRAVHSLEARSKKTGCEIQVIADESNIHVVTDALKLEQIITNLVQNSIEAFSRKISLRITSSENEAVIKVSDDGPGIPDSVLPDIFTPLFTTKKAGSGLGLPIVKKMVDSLGGDISVTSVVGTGTTFSVVLPVSGGGGERRRQTHTPVKERDS
jgi:signal transduction histidine kinase